MLISGIHGTPEVRTSKDVRLTNHWLSSNDSFSLTCLHCLSWWSAKVSLPSHGSILESRDPKTLLCSSKIKKFWHLPSWWSTGLVKLGLSFQCGHSLN